MSKVEAVVVNAILGRYRLNEDTPSPCRGALVDEDYRIVWRGPVREVYSQALEDAVQALEDYDAN